MGDTADYRKTSLYAGRVDVMPAMKLANAIATLKVVLVGMLLIGTIVVFANTVGTGISALIFVYGLAAAMSVYVSLSWLEQVLRLLVGIAHNTAAGGQN